MVTNEQWLYASPSMQGLDCQKVAAKNGVVNLSNVQRSLRFRDKRAKIRIISSTS